MSNNNEMFIKNLIKVLKFHPRYFSATWFNNKTLDSSVRSKNGIIIYKDGSIIWPNQIKLSEENKKELRILIKPIFNRDINKIISDIFKN